MTQLTATKDDEALLRDLRAVRDDTGAGRGVLEELVRRHVDFVYSSARRQVGGDAHLAEDVTQAVFVLLGRKRPDLAAGKLPGWLFNTTRFVARNAVRMESRRRKHERLAAGMRSEVGHDPSRGGGDTTAWSDVGPVLDQAVGKLGSGERDVVLLHYFQNMTLAEVARKLGISEVAARQRSSRAVGKLRDLLAKQGVACSAAGLVEGMRQHAVARAPEGVAAKTAAGLGTTGAGSALATAVTAAATALKLKIAAAVVGATVVLGTGAVVLVQHRPSTPSPTATASARPAAPDLSGTRTLHLKAVGRRAGFRDHERELLMDFTRNLVAEVSRVGDDAYVTWFDGKTGYAYKQGGDLVVRRTRGGYMSANDAKRFLTRMGAWSQSGPKRQPAADTQQAGTKLTAYNVPRWPLVGDRPVTLWVDSSNKPVKATGKSSEGDNVEFLAEWDRPLADLPTQLPTSARVVDDEALAAETFPLDTAPFKTESASHILAVHSARRDLDGNYHLIVTARPTDAARPLAAASPPPNFLARADGNKAKSVTAVVAQYIGGVTARHLIVVPAPGARDGLCEFDVTMLLWGDVTQALQERQMPIHGMPHVQVQATAGGDSLEQELRRTYDHAVRHTGIMHGGLVTGVQGTIPNDTPAPVVGWDSFRDMVTQKLKS